MKQLLSDKEVADYVSLAKESVGMSNKRSIAASNLVLIGLLERLLDQKLGENR